MSNILIPGCSRRIFNCIDLETIFIYNTDNDSFGQFGRATLNLKIRIKKGNFRTVLIVCDVFVLKFPKLLVFLKYFFKFLGRDLIYRRNPEIFSADLGWASHYKFIRGFKQNLDEFEIWRKTRAEFLAPTYLTLGVVNVQKFQEGDDLTLRDDSQEIDKIVGEMGRVTDGRAWMIDQHCFGPANFKRTSRGYVMVDYGRGVSGDFKGFLLGWHREIATVLRRPPKQI